MVHHISTRAPFSIRSPHQDRRVLVVAGAHFTVTDDFRLTRRADHRFRRRNAWRPIVLHDQRSHGSRRFAGCHRFGRCSGRCCRCGRLLFGTARGTGANVTGSGCGGSHSGRLGGKQLSQIVGTVGRCGNHRGNRCRRTPQWRNEGGLLHVDGFVVGIVGVVVHGRRWRRQRW